MTSSVCLSSGVYDIFVQKDKVSVCVGKYDNKGSFGELALMYNTPRAASIIATQDGALWGLVSPTVNHYLEFKFKLNTNYYSCLVPRIEPHFTE